MPKISQIFKKVAKTTSLQNLCSEHPTETFKVKEGLFFSLQNTFSNEELKHRKNTEIVMVTHLMVTTIIMLLSTDRCYRIYHISWDLY